MDVTELAARRVDNYIDMGCFRNPELVRPVMLEGFEMGYREAQQQIITDFRGDELDAVMTSVDKWLKGDELMNNPATRAADAREIALKAIEAEAARADRAEKELAALTFIPSGREHEIACSFAACDWGQGLAGMGRCSGHGNPRDPHCPKFTDAEGNTPEETRKPCYRCGGRDSGTDCAHCGPPAWESFVGEGES